MLKELLLSVSILLAPIAYSTQVESVAEIEYKTNALVKVVQELEQDIDLARHAAKFRQADFSVMLSKLEAKLIIYPNTPEIIGLYGAVQGQQAEYVRGLTGRSLMFKSRDNLLKAYNMNPDVLEGYVAVALSVVYYMSPSWPIGFNDRQKGKHIMAITFKKHPDGIDQLYYTGLYAYDDGNYKLSKTVLEKLIKTKSRPRHELADDEKKSKAMYLLVKMRKLNTNKI